MDSTPFWASRTLWVNVIAVAATVTGVFKIDLGLDATTQASIVTGVMAVVNIVLRLVTKTPISAGPSA
jgi:hypothetical protein